MGRELLFTSSPQASISHRLCHERARGISSMPSVTPRKLLDGVVLVSRKVDMGWMDDEDGPVQHASDLTTTNSHQQWQRYGGSVAGVVADRN